MSSLPKFALGYARLGWEVFPLANRGKTPTTRRGVLDATSDEETVKQWWTSRPEANIGARPPEGTLVLDIDSAEAMMMLRHLDYDLPTTVTAKTARGLHLWYRHSIEGLGPRSALMDGVDVRAGSSYVVVPPSIHPSGVEYEWEDGQSPTESDMAEAPEWLVEELTREDGKPSVSLDVKGILSGVQEGGRDDALFRYACRLRRMRLKEDEARVLVHEMASRCSPPFPPDEADVKLRQAWKFPEGKEEEEAAEASAERATRRIIPIEELMATTYEEPVWVVPGLIPSGLVVLAASPKIGKSFLAQNMAIAVSNGGVILGTRRVNQGEVLYLDLEQPPRKAKQRLQMTMRNDPAAVATGILFAFEWERFDKGGLEQLDEFLARHPRITMVVIDVLAKVVGDLPSHGNIYEQEYRRYHDLKAVFDRHNVAGICIHHDTKSKEGDPIDRVSGSRALVAAADAILVLQRPRGKSEGTLYCTGREIEDAMREVKWCPQTFQWTLGEALDPSVVNPEEVVTNREALAPLPNWDKKDAAA